MGLELDRDLNAPKVPRDPAPDPRGFYPTPKPEPHWRADAVKVGGVLLLVGLAVAGWGYYRGSEKAEREAAAAKAAAAEARREQHLLGEDGTDCFTGKEGEYLIYTDEKGTDVVVDSPGYVPKPFRKNARCVQNVRGR